RHPGALSDNDPRHLYNPKWTHTFAQWAEMVDDGHVVWNRGDGTQAAFSNVGTADFPDWRSDECYLRMIATHATIHSAYFEYEPGDPSTVEVDYAGFAIIDGDGTQYDFDTVRWNLWAHHLGETHREAYAIPYFLLSRITDRWGGTLDVSWNDYGV